MSGKDYKVPGTGSYDVSKTFLPVYKMKKSSGFASGTLRSGDVRKGMISN